MIVHSLRIASLCLIMLIGMPATLFAQPEAPLQTSRHEDITVHALEDLQPIADSFAQWAYQASQEAGFYQQNFVELLEDNREWMLGELASLLGYETPPAGMRERFDTFLLSTIENTAGGVIDLRTIQLWRPDPLKAFLNGGGEIPGYEFTPGPDGENQLTINKEWQLNQSTPSPQEERPPAVIILKGEEGQPPLEEAQERYANMGRGIGFMSAQFTTMAIQLYSYIFIAQSMPPAHRTWQWFPAGVATRYADAVVHELFSPNVRQQFDLFFSPQRFQRQKGNVRLAEWFDEAGNFSPNLENPLTVARTTYALAEIKGLQQRHGDAIIPQLMQALREKRPEPDPDQAQSTYTQTEMQQAATELNQLIEEITGDNMQERLQVYSASASQ